MSHNLSPLLMVIKFILQVCDRTRKFKVLESAIANSCSYYNNN
ncbi:hypothetical protein [Floridanema fluviatile]